MGEASMNEKDFAIEIINQYRNYLVDHDVSDKMIEMKKVILQANQNGFKTVFAGNGASAAIASHAALDFKKQAKINTMCFNEPSLITAYANDYGYENWLQKAIRNYCVHEDVIVLISSSGKSPNIINAANYTKENGITLITFSGFSQNNPLKSFGTINFWLNCKAYNMIENIHQIWLMTVCDLIIGSSEYEVS